MTTPARCPWCGYPRCAHHRDLDQILHDWQQGYDIPITTTGKVPDSAGAPDGRLRRKPSRARRNTPTSSSLPSVEVRSKGGT